MSLAKCLSILFIFSKNQFLVLLIFIIASFFLIYFFPDIYDLNPSANLGIFVLLFPVVLSIKLGRLFNVFLFSRGKIVLLYTSFLKLLLLHPIDFKLSCVHCHLFLGNFFISLLISSVTCSLSDFPDSSVGKKSACNEGDPGSIPAS